jgi:beta-glucanase (GH16 family)
MLVRTLAAILLLALAGLGHAAPPPDYTLYWSDEFDQDGAPNRRKWSYDTVGNASRWWSEQEQFYTERRLANARVEDGLLILETRKESSEASKEQFDGREFTSARLVTQRHKRFKYGFFEVRAKLPCAAGQFPAIWLLGYGRYPLSGEIDILEMASPGWVTANAHTAETKQLKKNLQAGRHLLTACDQFHSYQLEWLPDRLIFLIDGDEYHRIERQGSSSHSWPFQSYQYLILNVSIGGRSHGGKTVDRSAFPARMEVDYVRVYKKPKRTRR